MSSVGQNKYYLNTTNVLFDTMEETIGSRIAVSLVRAGMTQKELAGHMNVTTRTIKRWIDGEVDVMEKYRKDLPNVLNVTGEWLFYGIGEPVQRSPYPHDGPEPALRDALEQLPWACALVDEQWGFYFATTSYIRVFEMEDYVPIKGRSMQEMMPDVQQDVGEMVDKLLQAGKSYHTPEHQVWNRDDGRRWEMLYSLYPWRYDGKRGTIIECRSIIVDGIERIPQMRYVQTGVKAYPHQDLVENAYNELQGRPEHRGGSLGIINDILPDLLASKFAEGALNMLLQQGGGEVEVLVTEIFPVVDGSVRHVQLYAKIKDLGEMGERRLPDPPQTKKGPPDSDANE